MQTEPWYLLVQEAGTHTRPALDVERESYLVFLLMRHLRDVALGARPVAIDYLEALSRSGSVRGERLQALGDQCLLLAGWYPEQARRRRVSLDYFVRLGQGAYLALQADRPNAVALAPYFVPMMDALIWIRQQRQPVLSLLELMDLAARTNSRAARDTLQSSGVLAGSGTAH